MDLAGRVREAIEAEGLGPSLWKKRDCISFVRAVISAHGAGSSFALPEQLRLVRSEAGAARKAIKVFGSLRQGWEWAIANEPLLVPWEGDPLPGMIGLTADEYLLDGIYRGEGAALCAYGPDLLPYARTPSGIMVADPISKVWRVRV